MAIYHCSVKIIGRSSGRSAVAAAAYRSGEKLLDERQDITHDYTRKSGVDYSVILSPTHAPAWMSDRSKLWNAVEVAERRKDSQLAKEVELAIPTELNREQGQTLVTEYAQKHFVDQGMVADINIHEHNSDNPHAHIMLTTREISEDGFGKKDRDWNDKELLEQWRESWAQETNLALELAGRDERIDHRSYEAQGIDKIPTKHLGPNVIAIEQIAERKAKEQGKTYEPVTDCMAEHKAIQEANKELTAKVIQLDEIREQVQQCNDFEQSEPSEKNWLVLYDQDKKYKLADEFISRAGTTEKKIEAQQQSVAEQEQEQKQQQPEPEQPTGWRRWWGLKKYEELKSQWDVVQGRITTWANERLDTLNKRLDKIAPYLNTRLALERATEKIDKQNPALAELLEEHRDMLKKEEKERAEKLAKEQQRDQEKEREQSEQKQKELEQQQQRDQEKMLKEIREKREKERADNEQSREKGLDLGCGDSY